MFRKLSTLKLHRLHRCCFCLLHHLVNKKANSILNKGKKLCILYPWQFIVLADIRS